MTEELETISSFLHSKAAEVGASPHTLAAYAHDLKNFLNWCKKRKTSLATLSRKEIDYYLIDLTSDGLAATTRARRLSAINQYYIFCIEEGWREDNPCYKIKGSGRIKKLPATISVKEVDGLLEGAAKSGKTIFDRTRETCLMQLLYATGMRVSELMALPVAAARGNPKMLLVLGKGSKERLVPLSEPSKNAIIDWLKLRDQKEELATQKGHPSSPYLFPSAGKLGHLTRHWFYQKIKVWAAYAGIETNRVSPHTVRHAFATHLLANGADLRVIQMLLGHEDVSTTEIYTHVLEDKLQSLVEDHHPLGKNT